MPQLSSPFRPFHQLLRTSQGVLAIAAKEKLLKLICRDDIFENCFWKRLDKYEIPDLLAAITIPGSYDLSMFCAKRNCSSETETERCTSTPST